MSPRAVGGAGKPCQRQAKLLRLFSTAPRHPEAEPAAGVSRAGSNSRAAPANCVRTASCFWRLASVKSLSRGKPLRPKVVRTAVGRARLLEPASKGVSGPPPPGQWRERRPRCLALCWVAVQRRWRDMAVIGTELHGTPSGRCAVLRPRLLRPGPLCPIAHRARLFQKDRACVLLFRARRGRGGRFGRGIIRVGHAVKPLHKAHQCRRARATETVVTTDRGSRASPRPSPDASATEWRASPRQGNGNRPPGSPGRHRDLLPKRLPRLSEAAAPLFPIQRLLSACSMTTL